MSAWGQGLPWAAGWDARVHDKTSIPDALGLRTNWFKLVYAVVRPPFTRPEVYCFINSEKHVWVVLRVKKNKINHPCPCTGILRDALCDYLTNCPMLKLDLNSSRPSPSLRSSELFKCWSIHYWEHHYSLSAAHNKSIHANIPEIERERRQATEGKTNINF